MKIIEISESQFGQDGFDWIVKEQRKIGNILKHFDENIKAHGFEKTKIAIEHVLLASRNLDFYFKSLVNDNPKFKLSYEQLIKDRQNVESRMDSGV